MNNIKGKLVYCRETFQVFPSAKIAATYHNISHHVVYGNLNGRIKTADGKHFIYIENTADLSKFFATERREAKEREEMRKAAKEKMNELISAKAELNKQIAEIRKSMQKIERM